MEGRPGSTGTIESKHGRKNERNHFAYMGLDKRSNQNRGCNIILTYDPRSSTTQYLAGKGYVMGPGISNRVGTLNNALEKIQEHLYATHEPPLPPHSRTTHTIPHGEVGNQSIKQGTDGKWKREN